MRQHNDFAMRRLPGERLNLTEGQFLKFVGRSKEDNVARRQMLYAKFESLEEQLAHCYFRLHDRFIETPGLSRFWAETAMDEIQHHSILRYCRERGLMAEANIDPRIAYNVEELLETVKRIVEDPNVTVDEAFYASLLMESSELEDVYEKLTSVLAKDHRLLFEAIRSSLRSHHSGFAVAAEEFGRDRGIAEAFRNLGRYES